MKSSNPKAKLFNEEFRQFFEAPSRESLRTLLKNNTGEFPILDFKKELPQGSKLARAILGIANYGGGCIIVGVEELKDKTLNPNGVSHITDKADIEKGIKKFLPHELLSNVIILDFPFKDSDYKNLKGKIFQAILIESDAKHLPFISRATSGKEIIENTIYTRRGTSTEAVNYSEMQQIINRRLETGFSSKAEIDLKTHLKQLKILFEHIKKFQVRYGKNSLASSLAEAIGGLQSIVNSPEYIENDIYPDEDFEAFVARMIKFKKRRIEVELDVLDMSLKD